MQRLVRQHAAWVGANSCGPDPRNNCCQVHLCCECANTNSCVAPERDNSKTIKVNAQPPFTFAFDIICIGSGSLGVAPCPFFFPLSVLHPATLARLQARHNLKHNHQGHHRHTINRLLMSDDDIAAFAACLRLGGCDSLQMCLWTAVYRQHSWKSRRNFAQLHWNIYLISSWCMWGPPRLDLLGRVPRAATRSRHILNLLTTRPVTAIRQ